MRNALVLFFLVAISGLTGSVALAAETPVSESGVAASNHYMFIPASTFVPRGSEDSTVYAGGGCVTAGGESNLVHKLVLPDGSRLKQYRLYYKDEDVRQGRFVFSAITSYTAKGELEDMGLISTENGSGYRSTPSGTINHIVDMYNNSYVINVQFGGGSGSTIFRDGFETLDKLVFCGVRVNYEY